MQLTIAPRHGKPFSVEVEAGATVEHLKMEIEKVRAISGEEQFLTFRRLLLEDEIVLREYGITENAIVTLNVRLGFKPDLVPVRMLLPSGGSFVVVARVSQTVRSFKEMLCQTGQVSAPFELSCNGFFLDDDHQLAEYGTQLASNFSILNHLPQKEPSVPPPTAYSFSSATEEDAINVFFKPWNGNLVRVRLGKNDDLNSLRQLAHAQQQTSSDRRRVERSSRRGSNKEKEQKVSKCVYSTASTR
ncbi:unnamed protein product [Schistocephalus solidus]|uniref:Ubiquitin-like domain-containing protein n=1 Tax=Schistocephalus solidus TaxID=70667 RepID=A0A183T3Z1_SCHSO|nr:unnamed protein product [Schistocephalus solidus]